MKQRPVVVEDCEESRAVLAHLDEKVEQAERYERRMHALWAAEPSLTWRVEAWQARRAATRLRARRDRLAAALRGGR